MRTRPIVLPLLPRCPDMSCSATPNGLPKGEACFALRLSGFPILVSRPPFGAGGVLLATVLEALSTKGMLICWRPPQIGGGVLSAGLRPVGAVSCGLLGFLRIFLKFLNPTLPGKRQLPPAVPPAAPFRKAFLALVFGDTPRLGNAHNQGL